MDRCARCREPAPAGARFCPACGIALEAAPVLREQRKILTVVFTDVVGSTALGERVDSETLRWAMQRWFSCMRNVVERHGGLVENYVGDAVMAVFGAPVAQPHHAERAVAAAGAMHAAQEVVNDGWRQAGLPPFGLGIGISTGPAAAALLGSEERVEYTIVGDTVNLAQRLQQWAEPGETVLSEPTYVALASPVEAVALEPALVKGRATPVPSFKIPRRGQDTER